MKMFHKYVKYDENNESEKCYKANRTQNMSQDDNIYNDIKIHQHNYKQKIIMNQNKYTDSWL